MGGGDNIKRKEAIADVEFLLKRITYKINLFIFIFARRI